MDQARRKECYEIFYLVKGHLKHYDDDDLEAFHSDYTKRLWYNDEAHLYYDGFDVAYKRFKNCCMK